MFQAIKNLDEEAAGYDDEDRPILSVNHPEFEVHRSFLLLEPENILLYVGADNLQT